MAVTLCAGMLSGMTAGLDAADTDEKISFSIAIMNGPKAEDTWSEAQIEEIFNCEVELIFLPGWEDLNTKVNLLMSDDDQRPDVIWWSGMTEEY